MTTVTAVIPHWNRNEMLMNLFEFLRRQSRPLDEIIVVDNGSTDGSAEAAESCGARVIRMGYNSGFAAAVNRGIAECRSDWVAVLNNDVEPAPDWLETLLEAAGSGEPAFVTGKLLRKDRADVLDGCYDLPSRAGCAWRAGSGRQDGPPWESPRRIRSAPFTAALFRKDLFREVGNLDERFGSYLEDVEFGLRCALAGRNGLYVPQAVARHHGSGTLGEWSPETVRWIARNQVLLIAKHPTRGAAWPAVVGQLLWGFLAIRHGKLLPFLKGKADGLRSFRELRDAGGEKSKQQLDLILQDSERQILDLQRRSGFDLYWRLYFALT
jgi:GT2 family glycosyltransferase